MQCLRGLSTAYSRSSPVLLFAGQIPRGQISKNLGGVHEIDDQMDIVRTLTKWHQQALTPKEIPAAVSEAFRQMRTGRPRPTYIECPPNALVERDEVELRDPVPVSPVVPSREQLQGAATAISQFRLPLIVAGGGVALSGAEQALLELVEATNIPVVTSGPLHGDAKATINALLPLLIDAGCQDRPSPAEAVTAARRLIAYCDIRFKEPQYPILEALQRGTPEDAFTIWDVTQFGFYSRTHWQVNQPNTYIDSGYSFNLGYAVPTALGAKVAQPDRPVVCVAGDGGFLFNASELSTAVRYGINVTTVVFRDDSFGNVARDLDNLFGGTHGTDLANPDFVKLAESFGAIGMRADNPMDLESLIPAALEQQAPVIINVPIGHIHLERPKQIEIEHVPKLPWVHPQDGLISP